MKNQKILDEIKTIERQIMGLTMGDHDCRLELLRRRNELMGGSPNKLDHELLKAYYSPHQPKE